MMAEYETQYQQLPVADDNEDDTDNDPHSEGDLMIHLVPESSKSTHWNHIENLDQFFSRVYQYHQRQGFLCMVLEDVLQLIQFVFVVIFSTFLGKCVNYDILFMRKFNASHKVTLDEAILPAGQCLQSFDSLLVICLIVASAFWLFRVIKVTYNIFQYYEIRSFYTTALKVSAVDLPDMTWHEVQAKLLEVQKTQQMCIHKSDLTQLDIYHRILRFKNYTIAMVNKSVLPLKLNVPFLGEYVFLSTGLKYNLEFLLFWGPWSAFENKWHLKEEYKDNSPFRRRQLAAKLSQRILWLGLANLVLSPLIFLWQILYSFFRYAELVKRQPSFLGSRRWSNYGRQYLRHFNELDHEFNARLNRGYKTADMYLSIFMSPLLAIIAKNVAFFAGSVLAVLVVLTVIDEDVLNVEHTLTIMTIAGVVVTSCKVLIPDEHTVHCPEMLMRNILGQIHYIPEHWTGNAHTTQVRNEFGLLFQYKAIYLLEELFSPLITPLMLILCFRGKSVDIVDFFHNFTVDVLGVGDVCSFAQMDVRKHGNAQWSCGEHGEQTDTEASVVEQGEDGKTEMSLMHFHLTNPEWNPPDNCSLFLTNMREQVQRDATVMGSMQADMMGVTSYQSMVPSGATGLGLGYASLVSSVTGQSTMMSPSVNLSAAHFSSGAPPKLKGAVSQTEGPLHNSGGSGMLSNSIAPPQSIGSTHSLIHPPTSLLAQPTSTSQRHYDEGQLELMSNEMSFSALYMHDLRARRSRGRMNYESLEDMRARALWQRHDTPQATPSSGGTTPMPNIEERPQEEDTGIRESGDGNDDRC